MQMGECKTYGLQLFWKLFEILHEITGDVVKYSVNAVSLGNSTTHDSAQFSFILDRLRLSALEICYTNQIR